MIADAAIASSRRGSSRVRWAAKQAGGRVVGFGKRFKTLEPELNKPETAHWEKAIAVFDTIL